MIAQWFPQVCIVDQGDVLCRSTISQPVTNNVCWACSPVLVAAMGQVNLTVDYALSTIEIVLDSSVGIDHATSTAELDASFEAVAVGGDKVDPVLKCACHPPATGTFFFQPVSGKKQYIRMMQCGDASRFEVSGVHANEASQAAQGRFPYGHTQVTITCPARF